MAGIGAFSLILGDVATIFATIYWACLVIGTGLLLLSMFGGQDSEVDVDADADFDFDADADVDLDADAPHVEPVVHDGAAALATWFSLRFAVFFIMIFGAIGVVLTHLTPAGTGLSFAVALLAGLVVGQAVHHLFRYIRRTSGDSAPRAHDYVNKLGRVTISIVHPDKGEVAIQVRSAERYIPAVAAGSVRSFQTGDEVVVAAYRGGVAQVMSKEEFEKKAHST